MAVKQEFTFLSGDGKTDVHAVRWLPDNGDYRAVFQISHGMIEFIERYPHFFLTTLCRRAILNFVN